MSTSGLSPTVQGFVHALRTLEVDRDASPLGALLTADTDDSSVDGRAPRQGPAGTADLFTRFDDGLQT